MIARLAFWALNIYGIKKTVDLMKENVELKRQNRDQSVTIKTLAGKVSNLPESETVVKTTLG